MECSAGASRSTSSAEVVLVLTSQTGPTAAAAGGDDVGRGPTASAAGGGDVGSVITSLSLSLISTSGEGVTGLSSDGRELPGSESEVTSREDDGREGTLK